MADAETGQPIPGVRVSVEHANGRGAGRVLTDSAGGFRVSLREPGTYRVRMERVGYRAAASDTLSVAMRETVEVRLRLSASDVVLAPLTVTGRREPPRLRSLEMGGFYRRERIGLGRFLRREDIEERRPLLMSDLMRTMPGVRLVPARGGRYHVAMSRALGMGGLCLPTVFLDGAQVTMQGETLDGLVHPDNVGAIEVYRGPAEAPAEFSGANGACGVIVLWSRTGEETRRPAAPPADTAAG